MAARRVTGKPKRWQQGFTMVELVIVIAISSVIVVGSLMLLGRMITVSDENRNKTTASQEVQYVGFWISEDAMQAQNITLGNATTGFPLTLSWLDTVSDKVYTVIYNLEGPKDGLYKIEREEWIYQAGPGNVSQGKTLLGQHLVGQDNADVDKDGNTTEWLTRAYKYTAPQEDPLVGKVSSLILDVTANVYNRVATNEYEIHPRAFSVWSP